MLPKGNPYKRFSAAFIFSILLVFSGGCVSHITELREAQQQFNLAATLENQLRLDPLHSDALTITGHAEVSYLITLKTLNRLLETKKAALEKDNLLGTVYTLKALTEWRLARYSDAKKTVDTITLHYMDSLFSRDRVLIKALRGLIKNDQAYRHMKKRDYKYKEIRHLLAESVQNIQEAIATAAEDHNLRVYLTISQLAALKNWKDLRTDPEYKDLRPADFDHRKELDNWCNVANPVWSRFTKEMDSIETDDAMSMKNWWARRLSMPQACR